MVSCDRAANSHNLCCCRSLIWLMLANRPPVILPNGSLCCTWTQVPCICPNLASVMAVEENIRTDVNLETSFEQRAGSPSLVAERHYWNLLLPQCIPHWDPNLLARFVLIGVLNINCIGAWTWSSRKMPLALAKTLLPITWACCAACYSTVCARCDRKAVWRYNTTEPGWMTHWCCTFSAPTFSGWCTFSTRFLMRLPSI